MAVTKSDRGDQSDATSGDRCSGEQRSANFFMMLISGFNPREFFRKNAFAVALARVTA